MMSDLFLIQLNFNLYYSHTGIKKYNIFEKKFSRYVTDEIILLN